MFWWLFRTNETYAFLPRASGVGSPRISSRRLWSCWETLHAALATRAWQHWCAFVALIYSLPVSQAGQVGGWDLLILHVGFCCGKMIDEMPQLHAALLVLWLKLTCAAVIQWGFLETGCRQKNTGMKILISILFTLLFIAIRQCPQAQEAGCML